MTLRGPSPSLVISCIALFVALGGVGYAAATGSIGGREIKNNAVATKDLKNNDVRGKDIRGGTIAGSDVAPNTLTGSDIRETELGKVPSAGQADSAATAGSASTATSAGDANTVGGNSVRTFSRAIAENTLTPVVIASARGFSLLAACDALGDPKLSVDTTRDNARLHYTHTNVSEVSITQRVENVDASDPLVPIDGGVDDGIGTVTVGTSDGNSLTVTMSFGDADAFDEAACGFVGTAIG
jgi:hypothetical protein